MPVRLSKRVAVLAAAAAVLTLSLVPACAGPRVSVQKPQPATPVGAVPKPLQTSLEKVFGSRLGRYKLVRGQLILEVRGLPTDGELLKVLLTLGAVTGPTDATLTVMAMRPDDAWQSRWLIWDRNTGRLERLDGDGSETLFTTYPPGTGVSLALTMTPTGTIEGVDPEVLRVYAEGIKTPVWSKPGR